MKALYGLTKRYSIDLTEIISQTLPELLAVWTDSGDFTDDDKNKPLLTYFIKHLIDIKSFRYNKCIIFDDLEDEDIVYQANFSISSFNKLIGESVDNTFYVMEVYIKDPKWVKGRPVIQAVFSLRDLDKKVGTRLDAASAFRRYINKKAA